MSTNCKIVKVLSLLSLVYGLVVAIIGIVTLTGSGVASSIYGDFGFPVPIMGVITIVLGLFYLVAGFTGARAANRPSTLGTFTVFAAIIAVINILDVIMMFVRSSGGIFVVPLIYGVVALIAMVYAMRAKKEAAEF